MFITFDVSPQPTDGPGILLGFVDARAFDSLPAEQRRARRAALFRRAVRRRGAQTLDYVDHRWGAEPFAPGGPTAAVPPGSWTTFGPWLRRPVGPIHWAGTETADEWTGFLDGAVRSGQRAAAEVAAAGCYELMRRIAAVRHRFDERPQLAVDLVRGVPASSSGRRAARRGRRGWARRRRSCATG